MSTLNKHLEHLDILAFKIRNLHTVNNRLNRQYDLIRKPTHSYKRIKYVKKSIADANEEIGILQKELKQLCEEYISIFNGIDLHKEKHHGFHKYKGVEFTEFKGEYVEVADDHSNKDNPCYRIRFIGDNNWIGNMDDDDIDWQNKSV